MAQALVSVSRQKNRTVHSDATPQLTLETLEGLVKTNKIDTVCVAFPDHLGRLMGLDDQVARLQD